MRKILFFSVKVFFAALLASFLGAFFCATFSGFLAVSLFGGLLFAFLFGIFND